ncbi:ATP-binding protein [Paenibacillus larvae]|nr:ATP-binding protein [Paenibacillus larvae]MDT2238272.1 ATP-binding protein [Paenibacillus larvae]MDT2242313.1 ATP-binding protein [Paenibacillus larvae]MDT2248102.1 ATP-binding protein [Paenibacillus larvae]MDT2257528.1 ATP-binding protein [Paenibacillus larvae]MDT2264845.1 ATP-binding protein [Paenibacillus larvae]
MTDQGCGIAPEQMHKLGEPFYTTKEKGTGLGMMISYKIIEDHQGTMEIESKMGEGTTVSVYLPIMTE